MSNERMGFEESFGYYACGINGCILAERHSGVCVMPELSRQRSRTISKEPPSTDKPMQKKPAATPSAEGATWKAPPTIFPSPKQPLEETKVPLESAEANVPALPAASVHPKQRHKRSRTEDEPSAQDSPSLRPRRGTRGPERLGINDGWSSSAARSWVSSSSPTTGTTSPATDAPAAAKGSSDRAPSITETPLSTDAPALAAESSDLVSSKVRLVLRGLDENGNVRPSVSSVPLRPRKPMVLVGREPKATSESAHGATAGSAARKQPAERKTTSQAPPAMKVLKKPPKSIATVDGSSQPNPGNVSLKLPLDGADTDAAALGAVEASVQCDEANEGGASGALLDDAQDAAAALLGIGLSPPVQPQPSVLPAATTEWHAEDEEGHEDEGDATVFSLPVATPQPLRVASAEVAPADAAPAEAAPCTTPAVTGTALPPPSHPPYWHPYYGGGPSYYMHAPMPPPANGGVAFAYAQMPMPYSGHHHTAAHHLHAQAVHEQVRVAAVQAHTAHARAAQAQAAANAAAARAQAATRNSTSVAHLPITHNLQSAPSNAKMQGATACAYGRSTVTATPIVSATPMMAAAAPTSHDASRATSSIITGLNRTVDNRTVDDADDEVTMVAEEGVPPAARIAAVLNQPHMDGGLASRRSSSYKCGRCGLPKRGHVCAFKKEGRLPAATHADFLVATTPLPIALASPSAVDLNGA